MALKRKFNEVEIPCLKDFVSILGEPDELIRKTIKLDLSRKLRGRGVEIVLQIFDNGKLVAVPKKISLTKSYIRRMMRKRVDYVEDSFQAKCEDVRVIIKPFLITRKRVSRVVRKNLRNTAREFLTEYIKNKNYVEVCNEILSGLLQREMLPKLKKVYPLSFNDIRVFETKELAKADMTKLTENKEVVEQLDEESQEEIEEQESEIADENIELEEQEETVEKEIQDKKEKKKTKSKKSKEE